MRYISAVAAVLMVAGCGTTREGEQLAQSAGITKVTLDICIPQKDQECAPVKLEWLDGKAGDVEVIAYSPFGEGTKDERIIFHYIGKREQPEQVMLTNAQVKAAIAQMQIGLASDVVDSIASTITKLRFPISSALLNSSE